MDNQDVFVEKIAKLRETVIWMDDFLQPNKFTVMNLRGDIQRLVQERTQLIKGNEDIRAQNESERQTVAEIRKEAMTEIEKIRSAARADRVAAAKELENAKKINEDARMKNYVKGKAA